MANNKQIEDIFEDKSKPVARQALPKRSVPRAAVPGAAAPKKQPSGGRGWLMFISIGAIIIIIGGALWYVFSQGVLVNSAETGETKENINSGAQIGQSKTMATEVFVEADFSADADSDGLTDEEELELGTKVNLADSDFDNLFDREEVRVYKTDPLKKDTDGDGNEDGQEVANGYNPNGPGLLYDLQTEINKIN